jgi:lipopolysaccharide/colanic/teichoic acid biosynthesis glycosyltransferase
MTASFETPGSSDVRGAGRRTGRRVVVVGTDVDVLALVRRLRAEPVAGLTVVGAWVPGSVPCPELTAEGVAVLGGTRDVTQVLDDLRADAVLVAGDPRRTGTSVEDVTRLLGRGGRHVLVGSGEPAAAERPVQLRLYDVAGPRTPGPGRVAKSVVDRLAAAVLILLGALLLLLIAGVVLLDSPGGVLSRRRRLGQWGREFHLLGFRTTAADGSVTRVGRVLRRSGLDALPELVNVLVGDMSLVGPRPQRPSDADPRRAAAQPWLPVKPGITGLWHLRGGRLDEDGPVELDYYVRNWSPALDLRVLGNCLRAAVRSWSGR